MNVNEAEATLSYLEFHLIRFVEDMEKHITDPDIIAGMYDRAYAILNDFEGTLEMDRFIRTIERKRSERRS